MIYFTSLREWRGCANEAALHCLKFIHLTSKVVVIGLLSLFRAAWRFMTRQVGNYPSIALGGFLVAFFLVWLLTFASMRARAVSAEDRCCSIAYEYKLFKEQHGYE